MTLGWTSSPDDDGGSSITSSGSAEARARRSCPRAAEPSSSAGPAGSWSGDAGSRRLGRGGWPWKTIPLTAIERTKGRDQIERSRSASHGSGSGFSPVAPLASPCYANLVRIDTCDIEPAALPWTAGDSRMLAIVMIGRVVRVPWHNSAFHPAGLDRIRADLASGILPMADGRHHNGFSRRMDRRTAGFAVADLAEEDETRMTTARQGFGIEALDRELGGGLLARHADGRRRGDGDRQDPARLAMGRRGRRAEGSRGVICDLTSRGDSQNHHAVCTHAIWLGDAPVSPDSHRRRSSRSGTGASPWARIIIPSSGQAGG